MLSPNRAGSLCRPVRMSDCRKTGEQKNLWGNHRCNIASEFAQNGSLAWFHCRVDPGAKTGKAAAASRILGLPLKYPTDFFAPSAEITVTQPGSFLQLVWASLLGLYAFGEQPDLWTWIGAAIIVGSATYIARRAAVMTGRAEPKFDQG